MYLTGFRGYYDYYYVYLENNKTKGDETYIEGSFYETINEYSIFNLAKIV